MSKYSNKIISNDPKIFPPPLTWMTWIEHRKWGQRGDGTWGPGGPSGEGKLRHYYDLNSARKGVAWVGSASSYRPEGERGKYMADWAIYEWVEGEWVERYSGFAGQDRSMNPLSKLRLRKGQKQHPIDANMEDAALESIMKAVSL